MRAAEEAAADFGAVTDHSAFAVLTDGSDRLNCAFKAVEYMSCSCGDQLK
jgi:hypothetical protein